MGIFSGSKGKAPRRGGSKVKGKFVLPAGPGDGRIMVPRGPLSPRSAQNSADDAAVVLGVGKAKSGRWTR